MGHCLPNLLDIPTKDKYNNYIVAIDFSDGKVCAAFSIAETRPAKIRGARLMFSVFYAAEVCKLFKTSCSMFKSTLMRKLQSKPENFHSKIILLTDVVLYLVWSA